MNKIDNNILEYRITNSKPRLISTFAQTQPIVLTEKTQINRVDNTKTNQNEKMQLTKTDLDAMFIAAYAKKMPKHYETMIITSENQARQNGIPLNGTITFSTESLKPTFTTKHSALFEDLQIPIFQGFTNKVNIPVIDLSKDIQYNSKGFDGDTETNRYKFYRTTPKRVIGYINVDMEVFVRHTANPSDYVTDFMASALCLLEKNILSFNNETEDLPKGILNGVEGTHINSFDDILTMEEKVEDIDNKVYICHPSALRKLYKIYNNGNLIVNDKCINSIPFYTTLNMPKDTIVLGDFSKLYVNELGCSSVVIDSVTKRIYGIVPLIFETFYGFTTIQEGAFTYGYFGDTDPKEFANKVEEKEPTEEVEEKEPTEEVEPNSLRDLPF